MSVTGTRLRRQLRELEALPAGAPVPSPCSSVCRVDAFSGLCDGCLRTIDEIAAWSRLDDAGKREVWQRLGERAGLPPTPQEPR